MDKEFEQDEPSPEFVRKFNDGYTLTKYMPDIASQIADAVKETESGQGFINGREQYLKELAKERTPNWLKRDNSRNYTTDKSKGDIEPEKE